MCTELGNSLTKVNKTNQQRESIQTLLALLCMPLHFTSETCLSSSLRLNSLSLVPWCPLITTEYILSMVLRKSFHTKPDLLQLKWTQWKRDMYIKIHFLEHFILKMKGKFVYFLLESVQLEGNAITTINTYKFNSNLLHIKLRKHYFQELEFATQATRVSTS